MVNWGPLAERDAQGLGGDEIFYLLTGRFKGLQRMPDLAVGSRPEFQSSCARARIPDIVARNDEIMIIVRAPSDGDMDVGMFDISMIDGDPVEVGPRSRSASSIRSRVRL